MAIDNLSDIKQAHSFVLKYLVETPVWTWNDPKLKNQIGQNTDVNLKLEIFQRTGTFKPRGALININSLSDEERNLGVVAVSSGNHAIGVAFAAKCFGVSAKVFMPSTSSKVRVDACKSLGAEVNIVENLAEAYKAASRVIVQENRFYVHQYEGEKTVLGSATLGYEWVTQIPEIDALVIPIGGGGLFAGISQAVKLIKPNCELYGVEPAGSDVISQSIKSDKLCELKSSSTIADSLAVLKAEPYTTAICKKNLDEIVTVSDDEIRGAMILLFHSMKLAVEPAAAVSTAGLLGPLKSQLVGKKVGLLLCGTNIDFSLFSKQISSLT